MSKKFYAFGCSFTQGIELSSRTPYTSINPDALAWPQQTVDNLNYDNETGKKNRHFTCHNLARGGISPKICVTKILRTTFQEDDIAVILWPTYARTAILDKLQDSEHAAEYSDFMDDMHLHIAPGWSSTSKHERKGDHIDFYNKFYTDRDALFNLRVLVKFTDAYLKDNRVNVYHLALEPQDADPNWPAYIDSGVTITDWLHDDGKRKLAPMGEHLHPDYHTRLASRLADTIKKDVFSGLTK